mgnify:CR=1 FL=1
MYNSRPVTDRTKKAAAMPRLTNFDLGKRAQACPGSAKILIEIFLVISDPLINQYKYYIPKPIYCQPYIDQYDSLEAEQK